MNKYIFFSAIISNICIIVFLTLLTIIILLKHNILGVCLYAFLLIYILVSCSLFSFCMNNKHIGYNRLSCDKNINVLYEHSPKITV